MKQYGALCLLAAILWMGTACAPADGGAQAPQPTRSAETIVVVTPTETPAETLPNMDAFIACLTDISEGYHPGTAGCSLTAARFAGQLLDYYAENRPETERMVGAAGAFLASRDVNKSMLFPEQLRSVYDAALALTKEDAAAYLESAGYTPSAFPWRAEDVDTVFSAIYRGCGISGDGEGAVAPEGQNALTMLDISAPVSIDFNGDGSMETVTIVTDEEAYTTDISVADGANTYTDHLDTALMFLRAYTGDVLAGDGQMELFISGDMASDDYATFLFCIQNGALRRAEIYGTVTELDGNGHVFSNEVVNVLGTYGGTCRYTMGSDMTLTRDTAYVIDSMDSTFDERAIVLKRDGFPVQKQGSDSESAELPCGTKLLLVETDAESYAILADRDGVRYRVALARVDDWWEWYIGGVQETEWFEELRYAG